MKTFKLVLFRYVSPILLILTYFIPFISYWVSSIQDPSTMEIFYYSPIDYLSRGSYYSVLSALYLVCIGGYFALGITSKANKIKEIARIVLYAIAAVMYVVAFGFVCTFNMNVYGWLLQVLMFIIFLLNGLGLWLIKPDE